MKFFMTALWLGLFFVACNPTAKNKTDCVAKINPDCMCTQQYDPVCGCNGITYGNACQAGCADIKVVAKGPCPEKVP